MRVAVRLRLAVPFVAAHRVCPSCHGRDDAYGRHAFRCGTGQANRTRRHNLVRDALHAICVDAGVSGRGDKEPTYVERGFARKPGGVELETAHRIDVYARLGGTGVAIDVTVRHPTHASAHETRGVSAKGAEEDKRHWISSRYTISKDNIIPFAIETYGVMGEAAKTLLRKIARAKSGDDVARYAQLVRAHRSRIAVAVQRGNHTIVRRWLHARIAEGPQGGQVVGSV